MKKFALLLSFVFAAGVAVAQETASDAAKAKTPAKATATHAAKAAVKTHKVEAEVVSVDPAAKTITIKSETGENKTAPVEGKAVMALKSVKPGEKYTLTCRDNEAGEHQAVLAIMKTPAAKATAAKKSK
jgi:ABC-type Fe3+-hydroxamate transport system substrate-binding protein